MKFFINVSVFCLSVILLPFAKSQNTLTWPQFISILINGALNDIKSFPEGLQFLTTGKLPLTSVKYLLYQPSGEVIEIPSNTTTGVDFSKPTKIIIHGWFENGTTPYITRMAESFFNRSKDCTVFALDWSKEADHLNYLHSSSRLKAVGEILAAFIWKFTQNHPQNLKNVHVIGHSFGAHIAGFTGKWLGEKNVKINRITGLDPANPLFEFPINLPCKYKLCKGDAEYVDLIHSDTFILGVSRASGDSDFYMNGLTPFQPGCQDNLVFAVICSHQMSNEFFSESIVRPGGFEGVPCLGNEWGGGKVYMGEGVGRNVRGAFCVYTNYTAPTGI